MQMAALVAAAVFGPAAGAVTAYNAWAVYVSWRVRCPARLDRDDVEPRCAVVSCEN